MRGCPRCLAFGHLGVNRKNKIMRSERFRICYKPICLSFRSEAEESAVCSLHHGLHHCLKCSNCNRSYSLAERRSYCVPPFFCAPWFRATVVWSYHTNFERGFRSSTVHNSFLTTRPCPYKLLYCLHLASLPYFYRCPLWCPQINRHHTFAGVLAFVFGRDAGG